MVPKTLNWVSARFRRGNSKSIEGPSVHTLLPSPISISHHITEDTEEDTCSIWSMEEIDDNPGTGRIIDKYIYQRLGRTLERRANRVLGPLLVSPYEIARQLVERTQGMTTTQAGLVPYVLGEPLHKIIEELEEGYGPGLVSGFDRVVYGVRSEIPSRRIVALLQTLILSLNDWYAFKFLTTSLKAVLQECTLDHNKGEYGKLSMCSDNFANIIYSIEYYDNAFSQQTNLVTLRNVLVTVLYESSHSSLPSAMLSILPIFPSIIRNRRNLSLAAQSEVSWLALVILVWLLSANHSDTTRNSETTELYSTIGDLADIVASNYILRVDIIEEISSYECAERKLKVLSLFQLDPVKILLPIASKNGTHKCIFTLNEALQKMPHEVLYDGEGQLVLNRIYLHARALNVQLLTSFDRLKEAVETLSESQGRTTWDKYFGSSVLNRGEDLHIDKLPYPERHIRTHYTKNTLPPSTHKSPSQASQGRSAKDYTDASHASSRELYVSDQALRTAILVGVSFGLLLSSAGGPQSSESLADNTQGENDAQLKGESRASKDGSGCSGVYGDGVGRRLSVFRLIRIGNHRMSTANVLCDSYEGYDCIG